MLLQPEIGVLVTIKRHNFWFNFVLLFLQIDVKRSELVALIYSEGVSRIDNEYTSCEIPRHLVIRTLPNKVRL